MTKTYVPTTSPSERWQTELMARQSCYVLMPFGHPWDSYYEQIITPAIVAAGLEAVRADNMEAPGAIMIQIWRGIRDSTVCVAELTGRNPNVMYELGLAHAIRKPVVSVVQIVDDIPFDLRHLRHIVYDTSSVNWSKVLEKRITTMLAAVLADPDSSLAFTGALSASTSPELTMSHSQQPPYRLQRAQYTYHRIGVKNVGRGLAENVQVWLDDIVARPQHPSFRADFPYRIPRVDHLKVEPTGCRINPQDEERFQIASSWIGDERLMVGGLDTKENGEHYPLAIEGDGSWELRLRVSTANSGSLHAVFTMQARDKALYLEQVDVSTSGKEAPLPSNWR